MEDDLESFYQKLLAQKEINGAIVVSKYISVVATRD
jgi:hypothetical protein